MYRARNGVLQLIIYMKWYNMELGLGQPGHLVDLPPLYTCKTFGVGQYIYQDAY